MTNDEINIAIAEHRGWRNIKEIDYQPIGTDAYVDGPDQMWVGIHPESDVDSKDYEAIPDYCNDLNEMYEAKSELKGDKRIEFINQLGEVVKRTNNNISGGPYSIMTEAFYSTARQQAVAFLKTIGK